MTSTFGKMFVQFLLHCDLLNNTKKGNERTLYSLGHSYATMALTNERMSIYTLAKHMGPSVLMIEQHYAHVLLRENVNESRNVTVN